MELVETELVGIELVETELVGMELVETELVAELEIWQLKELEVLLMAVHCWDSLESYTSL